MAQLRDWAMLQREFYDMQSLLQQLAVLVDLRIRPLQWTYLAFSVKLKNSAQYLEYRHA